MVGAPEDRALRDCEDAFLLGDALLVAPVLECGADRRAIRLPRGRWYDTATGAAYEGPGQILLDAPPGRIPVLARAGAVLPVRRAGEGGVALEAWAPARGRMGGGVVIRDPGPGFEPGEVERYTVRWVGDAVVVENEAGEPVEGVEVRGLDREGPTGAGSGTAPGAGSERIPDGIRDGSRIRFRGGFRGAFQRGYRPPLGRRGILPCAAATDFAAVGAVRSGGL